MKQRVRIAIVVLGFSGLLAEIILLRELMIVFSGNELGIGIVLANWLILEAAGCLYPGKWADKTRFRLDLFLLLTLLFSMALIAAVFAARILKVLLGVSLGEEIGLWPMLYSSFFILMPVSLLHGALFTFSCRMYADYTPDRESAAGTVYVIETLGTMAGGIIFTFILIPLVHSFEAVIGLAILNMIVCLLLSIPAKPDIIKYRITTVLTAGFLIITSVGLAAGLADRLHQASIQIQWKNHQVEHYQNSPYGNIVVIENEGQYLFFLDGVPEMIVPVPDMPSIEEFVHIPMLAHPEPQDILVLRGGAGGVINEILAHPTVRSIDYAEHDPAFIQVIQAHPTTLTNTLFNDKRVAISESDGRLLLSSTDKTYDVIFIGVTEPSNLQSNRFFTADFYALVQKRLNPDGIAVAALPGSMTLQTEALMNLNSSIYHTQTSVFSHIRVIPGEKKNLYLMSDSPDIMQMDLSRAFSRLDERGIEAGGVVPWHIERKLHPGWQQWYADFIETGSLRINMDHNPVGLFYHITHWNALHAPGFGTVFRQLEHFRPWYVIPFLFVMSCFYLLTRRKKQQARPFAIPYAIFVTGFAGMIFSLILIFMFQVVFGHVFSWIGLLVACFMAGTAMGAVFVNRYIPVSFNIFLIFETMVILFALSLPLILHQTSGWIENPESANGLRVLFLALSVLSGGLVGAQYPLANKLMLGKEGPLSQTAGMLYASDLAGGWLGGIIGAVLLIPVIGISGTCTTVLFLKLSSMMIVVTEKR